MMKAKRRKRADPSQSPWRTNKKTCSTDGREMDAPLNKADCVCYSLADQDLETQRTWREVVSTVQVTKPRITGEVNLWHASGDYFVYTN